jgi:FkbM family methyltransferase
MFFGDDVSKMDSSESSQDVVTRFDSIRGAYERGELTKVDYANLMQTEHTRLAEYAAYIKRTDIGSITITDDSVVMTTRRHGIRIACDPVDKGVPPIAAINFGSYEKQDGTLLLSLVEDGMTFVDVGANIGWYSIHVGKMFPRSKVIAFEPVSKSYAYLKRNIHLNSLSNIQAHQVGLYNEVGERTFYVDPDHGGAASSSALTAAKGVPQLCKMNTLDSVVTCFNLSVDFIKIDVEGAELFVFEGGLSSIAAMRPIIFSELLRKHAATFGYHPNRVIGLLGGLGYRCFTSRGGRVVEFFEMDEQTVETNFIFLHGAKHLDQIARCLQTKRRSAE